MCSSVSDTSNDPNSISLPAIFGFPALFQLGFGKPVTDAVNSGRMFQQGAVGASKIDSLMSEQHQISEWISSAFVRKAPAPTPGVLVLLDPSSPSPFWTVSAKYATVVVRKNDLPRLRQALQGIWTQSMFSRVVVEVAATPQTAAQVHQPPADLVSIYPEVSSLPYSYFSLTAPPVPVPSTLPFVSAPKSLDEAVDLAIAGTPPITQNMPSA
jgi:hypothetical protein